MTHRIVSTEVTRMNAPTTCPCCGVVVMPREMSYDYDGETVASLTREVAYLRATIAHLRGTPHPTPVVRRAPVAV
jgi:hypothetical protein